MYKIVYTNFQTNIEITEYGFKGYINKRLAYLRSDDGHSWAKIYSVIPLRLTWDTFKKCLTKKETYEEMLDNSTEP